MLRGIVPGMASPGVLAPQLELDRTQLRGLPAVLFALWRLPEAVDLTCRPCWQSLVIEEVPNSTRTTMRTFEPKKRPHVAKWVAIGMWQNGE